MELSGYTPKIEIQERVFDLNIIDTIDSLHINFNKKFNDKIKEIYNIIDIEVLIYTDDLILTKSNKKLIEDVFSEQKITNDTTKLLQDIKDYIKQQETINELILKQNDLKLEYKSKNKVFFFKSNDDIHLFDKGININCDNKYITELEKYTKEKEFDIKGNDIGTNNMSVNDYSFCSSDNLNNYETNYKLVKDTDSCYLLYINYYNIAIVLENESYDINDLLDNFNEFTLIECGGKIHFKEFLHKRTFNNISEFKTTYDSLKSSLPKNDDSMAMKYKIENYIKRTFRITNDPIDRQKAFDFYNRLKKVCEFTFDSRQFSQILLELGLKKKRYGDGIYYYGLKEKNPVNLTETSLGKLAISESEYDNLQLEYNKTDSELNVKFNESFKKELFKGLLKDSSLLNESDANSLINESLKARNLKIEPLDKILTPSTKTKTPSIIKKYI